MTLWPFSTKPCPRTIRLEALGIPLTQRPSWVSSNIFIGKNSTNPSLFTILIPRVPESDKRSIEGEILFASILFVLISRVPVRPSLIHPVGFLPSASTLKLLVDGVALFETKLNLLEITSPVTSMMDTF